jgi:hypothetical protein
MATFGLFKGSSPTPGQKVEGDEMELDGDTVKIYAGEERELVAAFKLDVNQTRSKDVSWRPTKRPTFRRRATPFCPFRPHAGRPMLLNLNVGGYRLLTS